MEITEILFKDRNWNGQAHGEESVATSAQAKTTESNQRRQNLYQSSLQYQSRVFVHQMGHGYFQSHTGCEEVISAVRLYILHCIFIYFYLK